MPWQPGQSGNPAGRPRREVEERYLRVFRRAVKVGDWRDILDKAVELAKEGDKDARKFLAEYLVGKPTEYVNADVSTNAGTVEDMTDDELAHIAAGRSGGTAET